MAFVLIIVVIVKLSRQISLLQTSNLPRFQTSP